MGDRWQWVVSPAFFVSGAKTLPQNAHSCKRKYLDIPEREYRGEGSITVMRKMGELRRRFVARWIGDYSIPKKSWQENGATGVRDRFCGAGEQQRVAFDISAGENFGARENLCVRKELVARDWDIWRSLVQWVWKLHSLSSSTFQILKMFTHTLAKEK